jgi:hypothetical protein
VAAKVLVERDSQKGILVGRGGQALRALGEEARRDIEAFLERPVYLELSVEVSAGGGGEGAEGRVEGGRAAAEEEGEGVGGRRVGEAEEGRGGRDEGGWRCWD